MVCNEFKSYCKISQGYWLGVYLNYIVTSSPYEISHVNNNHFYIGSSMLYLKGLSDNYWRGKQ
jgi:hypothetical protein